MLILDCWRRFVCVVHSSVRTGCSHKLFILLKGSMTESAYVPGVICDRALSFPITSGPLPAVLSFVEGSNGNLERL